MGIVGVSFFWPRAMIGLCGSLCSVRNTENLFFRGIISLLFSVVLLLLVHTHGCSFVRACM